MKRVLSIVCITITLCSGAPIAQAGGGHGHSGGSWHGGGHWGGGYYGGCGAGWWPLVGLGIGLGVGFAASYPAHGYSSGYPAYGYSYAPASYAYAQPAYYPVAQTYTVSAPVAVATAPTVKPASTVVRAAPGRAHTGLVQAPVRQQPAGPPALGATVARTAAPRPVAVAAAAPARGTWVQDPHPYIYPPNLAPDRPSTASVVSQTANVGGPARTTEILTVGR